MVESMDGFGSTLDILRARPGWHDAVERLRLLHGEHGREARRRADGYGQVYAGRRAAMVFDVVASRQRRYEQRVLPLVESFSRTPLASSLAALAAKGPGDLYGLRRGEADTMQLVAAGLDRYARERGLDDDTGPARWAEDTHLIVDAPRLDPYVGCVKGMGPALLAYLRMRAGADGTKPDVRVHDALNALGFEVPSRDAVTILRLARGAAAELGISELELDQLLWWMP